MSKVFKKKCFNQEQTQDLAKALAEISGIGDTYALFGTLGAGKSVFARAFIQKLTKAKEVPSPTFTLVQTYDTGDFEIYHYDLYRLKSQEEIWELNIEEALFGAVTLIEWPEKMGPYLPRDVFKVHVEVMSDGARLFEVETNSDEKESRLKKLGIFDEA